MPLVCLRVHRYTRISMLHTFTVFDVSSGGSDVYVFPLLTNIFMIPQKDGTAKANFYIENTDMTRTKLTYEFTVKDNKVTSYELVQKNKKSKKQYEQGFK